MYKEFIQKDSLKNENDYLKKEIVQLKIDSRAQLTDLYQQISKSNKEKDSLQGLLLSRTDNSYEELKKMLNIDNSKKSTIIIKPKRK